MSDQRLGQDYGLRCVDTAVRRLCLLFLVLMFASIVDSAAAEVFRMDADTDFDTYDEGPDLDWPERIYLSAPAPNDRSVPDHSWLGNSCRELGTCYIEKFMKDNEVCRLFILKDGMQRLDLMVDSNGPCTRMNDYKNEGELERDGRYRLASVTKSLVSLLLGMTMEKDFGAGELDLNSSEALKNALSEAGLDYRSRATLAQLLQMRSGMHPWRENDDLQLNREIKVIENRKTGEIQDEPPFGRLKDKVRHYLAGKRFSNSLRHKYSSFDSTILGILVADRLKKAGKGESLAEGFDSLFWQPLEMTRNLQWKSDFSLNQPGFCCVKAHPHDIGKLGWWVLKRYLEGESTWMGKWVKYSVSDREAGADSCAADNQSISLSYGYQWWVLSGKPFGFTARGRYGQYLHIMPEEGVVAVQFSHYISGDWNERECNSYGLHRQIAKALRE